MSKRPFRYRSPVARGETQPIERKLFDEVSKGEIFRVLSRTVDDDPCVCELLQILSDETCELKRQLDELKAAHRPVGEGGKLTQYRSVEVAALQLGVPVASLKRMAKEGRIPVLHLGGRQLCDPHLVKRTLDDTNGLP
jgi:hypothetical protein